MKFNIILLFLTVLLIFSIAWLSTKGSLIISEVQDDTVVTYYFIAADFNYLYSNETNQLVMRRISDNSEVRFNFAERLVELQNVFSNAGSSGSHESVLRAKCEHIGVAYQLRDTTSPDMQINDAGRPVTEVTCISELESTNDLTTV